MYLKNQWPFGNTFSRYLSGVYILQTLSLIRPRGYKTFFMLISDVSILSGATLFAKAYVLVCRGETFKWNRHNFSGGEFVNIV